MNLYAESSAVLAWLLGDSAGEPARDALASAELVVASDLTLVECDRVLVRGLALGRWREVDVQDRRRVITSAASGWHLLAVTDEVLERSRRPFPLEPVRTLDALHLATALMARSAVPELAVLSLDDRVRRNARELGFSVSPA